MKSSLIKRLPGMSDIQQDERTRVNKTSEAVRVFLEELGYDLIDTPILEDAELFVRKSGGELTRQMFTFTDLGGHRITLRPEFTSSVIRHFIEKSEDISLPVRWQYSGPVFRYQPGNKVLYRQFNQVGSELIGVGGVDADAEVLSIACNGLQKIGVLNFLVRIGHVGVLNDALNIFGISERAKMFIISNVMPLKNGDVSIDDLISQASDVGLIRSVEEQSLGNGENLDIVKNAKETRDKVLSEISDLTGRRTPDEIVDRLFRKIRQYDNQDIFEKAIRFVKDISRIEGAPDKALQEASQIFTDYKKHSPSLTNTKDLMTLLVEKTGLKNSQIRLDFGFARGLTYYTGMIFEITNPSSEALCGGGRYDSLVKSLGGNNIPASGFAYTLDQVIFELNNKDNTPTNISHSDPVEK